MMYRRMSALCTTAFCATWIAAQTPQAGNWEFVTSMQGAPGGEKNSTTKSCVSAAQIATGFEQTIVNAGGGGDGGGSAKNGLKCSLKDIKRESASSSWQATCEGPRGPMPGTGAATFEGNRANLTQTFELKTPIGNRTLKQVIAAQRVGDC
jgi:Protein of unknown function (DUF3617)